jgi:hypothetical protein
MARLDVFKLVAANRAALSANIADSIVDGTLTTNITGEATLEIVVLDPDGRLLDSDLLVRNVTRSRGSSPAAKSLRPIDVRVDGQWWRLTSGRRDDERATLEFEQREVSYLRQHDDPTSASRAQLTRALFIRRLVQEIGGKPRRQVMPDGKVRHVTAPRVPFWSPEVRRKRPIAALADEDRKQLSKRSEPDRSDVQRARHEGKQAAGQADLTVKGKRATAKQRRVLAGVVAECDALGASTGVTVAAVCAVIQESTAGEQAGVMTGNDDVGVLQQGRNWISLTGAQDPGQATKAFLLGGGSRGARGWKQIHGSLKVVPGGIEAAVKKVQVSIGGYAQWAPEARKIVSALAGVTAGALAEEPGAYVKSYRFQRRKGEDSWACTSRLADEVKWRRFIADGTFVFAPDTELLKLPVRAKLKPSHPAVTSVSYELDYRRTVREVTLGVLADEWEVPVGQPILLQDAGPAEGRWLVTQVTDPRASMSVQVTLSQPQREQPEPAPEVAQRASTTDSEADGSRALDAHAGPDEIRKLYRVVQRFRGPYVYGAGHGPLLSSLSFSQGLDCSSSCSLALHEAGLFEGRSRAIVSGDFAANYGQPGRGRYVTICASSEHVWMMLHGLGRFVRFDTSAYGSGGSGPRARTTDRPSVGFTFRHPAGL